MRAEEKRAWDRRQEVLTRLLVLTDEYAALYRIKHDKSVESWKRKNNVMQLASVIEEIQALKGELEILDDTISYGWQLDRKQPEPSIPFKTGAINHEEFEVGEAGPEEVKTPVKRAVRKPARRATI